MGRISMVAFTPLFTAVNFCAPLAVMQVEFSPAAVWFKHIRTDIQFEESSSPNLTSPPRITSTTDLITAMDSSAQPRSLNSTQTGSIWTTIFRLASCSFHWRRSYRLRLGKKTVVWMFRILIRYDTLVCDDAFGSVGACDVFFILLMDQT